MIEPLPPVGYKAAWPARRRGIEVHAFNQRTVAGILDMIWMVGAMVSASAKAEEFVGTLELKRED